MLVVISILHTVNGKRLFSSQLLEMLANLNIVCNFHLNYLTFLEAMKKIF